LFAAWIIANVRKDWPIITRMRPVVRRLGERGNEETKGGEEERRRG